jgi:thioredoxin 1
MTTIDVTEATFKETVREGVVLLDFWAAWCGPCRAFKPVFEAASSRHPDVVFGKIDVEAQTRLAEAFQIQSIPTLMALRDGVLLAIQPGALPGPALDDLVREVQALDMDEVRRRLADREHPAENAATPAPASGT